MQLLHWRVRLCFLIVVNTGLISESFSNGVKSCLKSDPFSKHDFAWKGVSAKKMLLKNWLTLSDNLSMYLSLLPITSLRSYVGILNIFNQVVAGSIIIMQARIKLFLMLDLTG